MNCSSLILSKHVCVILRDYLKIKPEERYKARAVELKGDRIMNEEARTVTQPPRSSQSSSREGASQSQVLQNQYSKLCSTCAGIFSSSHGDEWYDYDRWYLLHQTRAFLRDSASSGCSLCQMMLEVVIAQEQDFNDLGVQYSQTQCDLGIYYSIDGYMKFRVREGERFNMFSKFPNSLSLIPAESAESSMTKVEVGLTTAFSGSIRDLAHDWLRSCRSKHKRCRRATPSGFIPTRLVHVDVKESKISLRLCSGSNLPADTVYVTLSHCWGQRSIFSLTTKNERKLNTAIPWAAIPKNFQDAAIVTQKLGFNYVWIDSLCIIQDSASDWFTESSRMGNIYKFATLNIAATGFPNGGGGFFAKRDPKQLFPVKVFANWDGNWPTCSRQRRGQYLILDEALWRKEISEAPLNRRGWVFQERLLSPCILHFGSRQIYWECAEMKASEIFPDGLSESDTFFDPLKEEFFFEGNSQKTSPLKTYESSLKQSPCPSEKDFPLSSLPQADVAADDVASNIPYEPQGGDSIYYKWMNIVQDFSSGAFSYPEDKLTALTGIAKEIKAVRNDRYLAGLWRQNLYKGLLWSVESQSSVGHSFAYRAPTWSWASIDGKISYIRTLYEMAEVQPSKILDAHTTPLSDDETGRVVGGHIRIKGPLIEVFGTSIDTDDDKISCWAVKDSTLKVEIRMDYQMRSGQNSEPGTLLKIEQNGLEGVSLHKDFQNNAIFKQKRFLCTILAGEQWALGLPYVAGLVLAPCEGIAGQYFRCGMFEASDVSSCDILLDGDGDPLQEQYYEEYDGIKDYTITIV